MNWYPTARCLALAEMQVNRMMDRTGGAQRAEPLERAPRAEARPAGPIPVYSVWRVRGDGLACIAICETLEAAQGWVQSGGGIIDLTYRKGL